MTVSSHQRFSRDFPCPICNGCDRDPRGQGSRCYGFLSDDGEWAHCTREEHAGDLDRNDSSDTFAHRLAGPCGCGREHAPAVPPDVPRARHLWTFEATYDYHDADGELLFQVVRYPEKAFRQRQPLHRMPDPLNRNHWVWNIDGIEPVLYRLPELLAADPAAAVFLCEGEKDADRVASLGLIATTNPMGARKWRPSYSETLRGRDVVILEDNDEKGRKHGQIVGKALAGVARSVQHVRFEELPEGGDVSDWLDAGHSGIDLAALAAAGEEVAPAPVAADAPAKKPAKDPHTLATIMLSSVKARSVSYLWRPYIPLGAVTMSDGDPGVGKTLEWCAIASAVTRGAALPCNREASLPPARVLVLAGEEGLEEAIVPRLRAAGADLDQIMAAVAVMWSDREHDLYLDPEGLSLIADLALSWKPALIVIDPIVAFLGGEVDTGRSNEVRAILRPLAQIARQSGAAILALRHLTKAMGGKALYRGQMSIDFNAAARSALIHGEDADVPGRFIMAHVKSQYAARGPSLAYRIIANEDGNAVLSWDGVVNVSGDQLMAGSDGAGYGALDEAVKLLESILADGEQPAREITRLAKDAGISDITLRRARSELGCSWHRRGVQGKGAGAGEVVWRLPDDPANTPKTILPFRADQLAHRFPDEQVNRQPESGARTAKIDGSGTDENLNLLTPEHEQVNRAGDLTNGPTGPEKPPLRDEDVLNDGEWI